MGCFGDGLFPLVVSANFWFLLGGVVVVGLVCFGTGLRVGLVGLFVVCVFCVTWSLLLVLGWFCGLLVWLVLEFVSSCASSVCVCCVFWGC